jgi:hypothetical protein
MTNSGGGGSASGGGGGGVVGGVGNDRVKSSDNGNFSMNNRTETPALNAFGLCSVAARDGCSERSCATMKEDDKYLGSPLDPKEFGDDDDVADDVADDAAVVANAAAATAFPSASSELPHGKTPQDNVSVLGHIADPATMSKKRKSQSSATESNNLTLTPNQRSSKRAKLTNHHEASIRTKPPVQRTTSAAKNEWVQQINYIHASAPASAQEDDKSKSIAPSSSAAKDTVSSSDDGPPPSDLAGDGPPPSNLTGDGPPPSNLAGDGPPPSDLIGDGPPPSNLAGDGPPPSDLIGDGPPKCCSRDYCTMNGTIKGVVQHHCKKCSGPFHGSLCSANGSGPSDDGIGMICFSCQPPKERATENKSKDKHNDNDNDNFAKDTVPSSDDGPPPSDLIGDCPMDVGNNNDNDSLDDFTGDNNDNDNDYDNDNSDSSVVTIVVDGK